MKRIGYPPAGCRFNIDKGLIVGGDLVRFTIPDQDSFFKELDMLDKRGLPLQSGLGYRGPDRGAELGDNSLPAFFEDVEAVPCRDNEAGDDDEQDNLDNFFHIVLYIRSRIIENFPPERSGLFCCQGFGLILTGEVQEREKGLLFFIHHVDMVHVRQGFLHGFEIHPPPGYCRGL